MSSIFVVLFVLLFNSSISLCPSSSYFETSLCFSSRPKNAPNCYFGPYPSPEGLPQENTIVAFTSDVGLNSNSRAVLSLIKDKNASMVFHAGDLDYHDSPYSWENQVDQILGENFPYFTSFGNHE